MDFRIGEAFANSIKNPDRIRIAYDDSTAYLSSIYKMILEESTEYFDIIITLSENGEMLGEYRMWNQSYGIYPEFAQNRLII